MSDKETDWVHAQRKEAIDYELIVDIAYATSRYISEIPKEWLLRLLQLKYKYKEDMLRAFTIVVLAMRQWQRLDIYQL